MLTSLAKHSFGAILLAVIIEEVGIPLPIPSDFLVIFAAPRRTVRCHDSCCSTSL
jgi:hypothetical protein